MIARSAWRPLPVALVAAGLMAGSWLTASAADAHVTSPTRHPALAAASSVKVLTPNAKKVWSRQRTLAYWTPARMRAAKPVHVADAQPKPSVRPATAHPAGKPGSVAGGFAAAPGPAAHSTTPTVTHASGAVAPNDGYTYPYPFDSFTLGDANSQQWPYDLNGVLFFTQDGIGLQCSATAVASAAGTGNENEIWTAGDCLVNMNQTDQQYDTSAVFVPGYDANASNPEPYGEFVWDGGAATPGAWWSNADLSENEAAMTVGTSSTTGETLGQSVGWDGFAWNQPVNEQFVTFGYEGANENNVYQMGADIASTAGQASVGGANAIEPTAIGSPAPGGDSEGGAWNIDWSDTGPGYIDGVNEFITQGNITYSPYQDSLSNQVRCLGASSC